PEEYDDTEALAVQDPLISSRASTTIKLIDPGKYIAGKIAALFPLDYKGQRKETSRWKDLGDLMIMASHVPISPDTIQRGLKYIENLHNSLNKLFGHRPNSDRPYTKSFRMPAELNTIRNDAQRNEDIVAGRVRPPQGEKPEDTRKRKGFEQRQLIQHCSVVHPLKKVFERLSRLLDPCFHCMEPHRRETDYRQELRTFARTPQMWVPGEEEAGLGVWEKKSKVGDLPEKLREMRGDYVLGKGFEKDLIVSKRSQHGIIISNGLPKGYGASQKRKNDSKDTIIDSKKHQGDDKKQNNAQSLSNNYSKHQGIDVSLLENGVDNRAADDSIGDQELNTDDQKEKGEFHEGEDNPPENRDDDDDNDQGMQL
ncbi:nucleotidyl transferase AbiEii/AbiGii toxin family protein, partial [Corynebacterium matruchotii]